MIIRTAAVCLVLTATLCSAQEQQGTPAERAQQTPQAQPADLPALPNDLTLPEIVDNPTLNGEPMNSGDPVLLPDAQGTITLPDAQSPPQSQPADPAAPVVTDVSINPDLASAVPLTLIGRDSRDGAMQSQLLFSDGEKPGQVRVQRQVTLPDGNLAVQNGVGKVRGDRIKVKLRNDDSLTSLMTSNPLEPVDLNLRLNRRTNVVTAEGICPTHEFTAQATDAGQLAPLLDKNQGRTRTFFGKLKARWKNLMTKVRTMFYGMRAKFSAWRAKRAVKRSGNATEAAARHQERAQRFGAKAQALQATPPAEPITIERPPIQGQPLTPGGPAQALPQAEPIGHASPQALPQVDAPLVQGSVEPIQVRPKPAKRGNFFSRAWRRVFKKADR